MILYHRFDDHNQLPDYVIQEINFYKNNDFRDRNLDTYNKFNFSGYANRILTKNGKQYPSTKTQRTSLSSNCQNWFKDNICSSWTECSFSITPSISESHGPHTDVTRLWLLMYVIDSGGDNATNCFWRQKGHDLVRLGNDPITVCNYNELELVAETKFVPNQWALINTKVLHSVENIRRPRISIHIGLNDLSMLNTSFKKSLNI